jgi:hypothetical protein
MFTKQEKLLFKSQSSDHLRVRKEAKESKDGLNKSTSSLKFLPIAQLKKDEIPGQF